MEGVRTNAICMILHVLARPGCAHRVSAFCLRFPLAFLAAVTQPPRNEGGGERRRRRRKGLRAAASSCAGEEEGRETGNYFSWFFSAEYRWAAKKKGGKESFEGVVLSGWREIIGKNLPYRHVRMTNNWNGEAAFSVPSFSKLDLTRI